MCAQRNFRTSYYNSLGFHGVDVKMSLEGIMSDKVIDIVKLQKFSLKFGLPAMHRNHVWKIILKVLPAHRDSWKFVESQRRALYFDLKKSLMILRGNFVSISSTAQGELAFGKEDHSCSEKNSSDSLNDSSEGKLNTSFGSTDKTGLLPDVDCELTAEILVQMCLLNEGFYQNRTFSKFSRNHQIDHMLSVANVFIQFCDCEVDGFFLCLQFLKSQRLCEPLTVNMLQSAYIYPHINCLSRFLRDEDFSFWQYFDKLGIQFDTFSFRWFRSCFAESLPLHSLERIWDTLLGGNHFIIPFIGLSLLLTFKRKIIRFKNANEVQSFLQRFPDINTENLINMATELLDKHNVSHATEEIESQT